MQTVTISSFFIGTQNEFATASPLTAAGMIGYETDTDRTIIYNGDRDVILEPSAVESGSNISWTVTYQDLSATLPIEPIMWFDLSDPASFTLDDTEIIELRSKTSNDTLITESVMAACNYDTSISGAIVGDGKILRLNEPTRRTGSYTIIQVQTHHAGTLFERITGDVGLPTRYSPVLAQMQGVQSNNSADGYRGLIGVDTAYKWGCGSWIVYRSNWTDALRSVSNYQDWNQAYEIPIRNNYYWIPPQSASDVSVSTSERRNRMLIWQEQVYGHAHVTVLRNTGEQPHISNGTGYSTIQFPTFWYHSSVNDGNGGLRPATTYGRGATSSYIADGTDYWYGPLLGGVVVSSNRITSYNCHMTVHELLVFDQYLSNDQVNDIGRVLAKKWKTGNVPGLEDTGAWRDL